MRASGCSDSVPSSAELDARRRPWPAPRRGPSAPVEEDDLRADEAAELQGEQRQQHRLAGAGRADDQGMADIADMQIEPERRAAARLASSSAAARSRCRLASGPAHTADTGIM